MKIVAIGDIHGRKQWLEIINKEGDADKVVFIGDYFDSFQPISAAEQIKNFNHIAALVSENPEKYTMLIGNHDFHYIMPGEHYSGYQELHAVDIGEAVLAALKNMRIIHTEKNFLFAHAGVTNTWMKRFNINQEELKNGGETTLGSLCFSSEDASGYGEHKSQSPIWVRPNSLRGDMVPGFVQVVGHTNVKNVLITPELILIDALGKNEYLVIEDNIPRVGTI